MKYGRKNFNNFLWINHAQGSDVSIQQINEAFTKPREDFERLLSSKENKELFSYLFKKII